MRDLALLAFLAVLWLMAPAQEKVWERKVRLESNYFVVNQGQWPSEVLGRAEAEGVQIWITQKGLNLVLLQLQPIASQKPCSFFPPTKFTQPPFSIIGHRILVHYVGANENPTCEGRQPLEGYHHYLLGDDPSQYVVNLPLYKELIIKGLYEGVNIRYYFDRGKVRFDYQLTAGVDPSKIKFSLEGSYGVQRKESEIVLKTCLGDLSLGELRTIQCGQPLRSRFVREGALYSVAVNGYQKDEPMVIDPLIYTTYIGGNGEDHAYDVAIDSHKNVYLTGYTLSFDYDTTAGAFQTANAGGFYDAFVTKLDAAGNTLLYSTYLGGSNEDRAWSIAVDPSGNVLVVGNTQSHHYPTTPGAYQTTYGGGYYDVFVTKLNDTGTALLYSTYLGGTQSDYAYALAIDSNGNAYVTGYTESTDYDTTAGAYQTTNAGSKDIFVTQINATGTALVYSTYLGGTGDEQGRGITVDHNGNVYITGETWSTDYDTTFGAYQTTLAGGNDVLVTKLNPAGNNLLYSTYLGGTGNDWGYSITVDENGNAYVTGWTNSADYDTTAEAFQTLKEGGSDAFVTKLNSDGTSLVYSTYLGGTGGEVSHDIAVDNSGNAYITGETSSTDFDTTADAYQTTNAGGATASPIDVFVTALHPTGKTLLYSTYLGGKEEDYGNGIAVDSNRHAYITGETANNFDTTGKTFHVSHGGKGEVFLTKLDLSNATVIEKKHRAPSIFYVYPNPNSGEFTIGTGHGGEFEVIDLRGKVLQVFSFREPCKKVQVSLPAGMYFLRERQSGIAVKVVVE